MAKKVASLSTQTVSLTVDENSTATPIGIPAPKDSQYSSTRLTIKVTSLPTDGTVLLSNGKTAVYVGETLTVAQLTALLFKPNSGVFSQSSSFSYTVTDPSGASTTGTATLAIAADKLPPVTTSASLTVAENSAATAIGIAVPADPNYTAAQLGITITTLPTDGTVFLSDGVTTVTAGETLTIAQLTGLMFAPLSGLSGQSSILTYRVTDPSGLSTTGTATLSIATNATFHSPTPPPAATANPIAIAPSAPPALPVSGAPNNMLLPALPVA